MTTTLARRRATPALAAALLALLSLLASACSRSALGSPAAVQHNIEFDPSERYAVAHYDDTDGAYMAVWALDDPSTPHRVLANGETGWSFWVEGPAL